MLQIPTAASQGQLRGSDPHYDRTLAENAGQDAPDIIGKARSHKSVYKFDDTHYVHGVEQSVGATVSGKEWPVASAYPVSLVSRWSPDERGGAAQRVPNRPRKRSRNRSVESPWATSVPRMGNGPGDPATPVASNSPPCAKLGVVGTKYTIQTLKVARDLFISRWAPVFPRFTDWARLIQHETAGKRLDQKPYEELDKLMTRVCQIGTSSVQKGFASSVVTWLASPYAARHRVQTPKHLLDIPGFDAAPFQKFCLAEEMGTCSQGVEDMSIILRRKAMADFLCAYHEVVAHVRQRAARRSIRVAYGEGAAAEARKILYEIIYPDLQSRSRAWSFFNSSQTRGSPYYKLEKSFGSIGILAMIPTKTGEAEFRASNSLFKVFLELLDLLCPELHDTARLNACGKILELICRGETPEPQLMHELSLFAPAR